MKLKFAIINKTKMNKKLFSQTIYYIINNIDTPNFA